MGNRDGLAKLGVYTEHRDYRLRVDASIEHLTPEAASAAIEVSRNTYAVPAQERTRRELLRARTEQLKAIITCVCVLSGIVGVIIAPEGKSAAIAAIVSVVGGLYAVREIVKALKKRGDDEG